MLTKEHIVKPCKRCGKPMQVKTNRETGEDFLGCSAWPGCLHTEPLPEAIKLRRQGYQDMFEGEDRT